MNRFGILIGLLSALMAVSSCTSEATPACQNITYAKTGFTVCHYKAGTNTIRTYLYDAQSAPYGQFFALQKALQDQNQDLLFAMNGGMYHDDRSAVGLYIEDGKQLKTLSTKKGPGNFHMMPNGVFYMNDQGVYVLESKVFDNMHRKNIAPINHATQSGPMLVINGKLHPKFNKTSTSKHIRNGVGVRGDDVYFVISNEKVNFHTFASLFKDHLKTPNALYLDGVVSKIYAPELNRQDIGRKMGPMIAVVGETP